MQNNNYFVLKKILTENLIEFNSDYNISKYTPIKYPLISKLVIYPKSQTEFINTLNILKNHYDKKITCFGKFSNTIIHENSNVLNEPIIITKNLNKIEIKNNKKICEVEAGFPLPKFCKILSYENFKGFSGMLGIPGSIGGAIYMNAGSFENEISDNLISVDYIDKDLNLKTIYKNYHSKAIRILKELCPEKVELYDYSDFSIIVTSKNSKFPIHDDTPNKLLSGVIYLMPENNSGTIFYNNKAGRDKTEIKWKKNRAVFFSRKEKETWHSYEGNQKDNRIALVYNLNTRQIKKVYAIEKKNYFFGNLRWKLNPYLHRYLKIHI